MFFNIITTSKMQAFLMTEVMYTWYIARLRCENFLIIVTYVNLRPLTFNETVTFVHAH